MLLLLWRQLLCDRLSWQRRLRLRVHAIAMLLRWMLHRLGGRNCERLVPLVPLLLLRLLLLWRLRRHGLCDQLGWQWRLRLP